MTRPLVRRAPVAKVRATRAEHVRGSRRRCVGEAADPDQVRARSLPLARQLVHGPATAYAKSKRLILEGAALGFDVDSSGLP